MCEASADDSLANNRVDSSCGVIVIVIIHIQLYMVEPKVFALTPEGLVLCAGRLGSNDALCLRTPGRCSLRPLGRANCLSCDREDDLYEHLQDVFGENGEMNSYKYIYVYTHTYIHI